MALVAHDLTPNIGTEVEISRQELLDGVHAKRLRELLEARGVLVFRGLALTKAEQRVFAATLGEVQKMGDEGIQPISLDKTLNATADYLRGAFYWHIDGASDDLPTLAGILTAQTLSPSGGDTQFANTYTAYDALTDEEKRAFDKLKVVHSLETSQYYITPEPSYAELLRWRGHPPKVHPLVWTHRSGRKSLVLGSTASHVADMPLDEGRALLIRLRDAATRPENVFTHKWTPGDTLIWDNTGVMHRVTPYAIDSGRMMHRTTLAGEEPLV
jgi:alpha-ketoglutarate-dependent taurine dioxygenase